MNAQPFTTALRRGDVLLSLGIGKTSEAIKALDGGIYSHAALWTGDTVIESTTPCVQERTLDESLRQHPREYVDAYRHKAIAAIVAADIVAQAREYVNRVYSYGDLFLCASLMAMTTALPRTGQIRFLKEACEFFHFMSLDRPRQGEHVTCTQLVVRSFFRAGLAIRICPKGGEHVDFPAVLAAAGELAWDGAKKEATYGVLSEEERDEWGAMQAALCTQCSKLTAPEPPTAPAVDLDEVRGPLARWDGRSAVNAEGEWRSNLVTPHDLQTSPDLEFVAHVYGVRGAAEQSPP